MKLKELFEDILLNYEDERTKIYEAKKRFAEVQDPYFRNLQLELIQELDSLINHPKISVNAIPGKPRVAYPPYISFLYGEQGTSKGFYPIIGFDLVNKNVSIGFGHSETHKPPIELINKIVNLVNTKFKELDTAFIAHKGLYLKKNYALKDLDNDRLKNDILSVINIYLEIVSKFENEINNFLLSIKSQKKTMKREKLPSLEITKDFVRTIPLNTILYGPPGTGKTYHTINRALAIIDNREIEDINNECESEEGRVKIRKKYSEYLKSKRIVFTTFHQNYSYEDFIEGIKPILGSKKITYDIKRGIFQEICVKAKENEEHNYVLIIDEINRGNVSQIFGELITLIEEDKRAKATEELEVTLPYSGVPFSVPKNLYIIGTMNTADRSVEALDTALRRRFHFEEMMPNSNKIENDDIEGIKLKKVMDVINERIRAIYGRDHQIGHSYFMDIQNLTELRLAFKNKIVPLLQEYFFSDYEKLQAVLGAEFVTSTSIKTNLFPDKHSLDLAEKIFELTIPEESNFKSAIEKLLTT